jgi:hypothetical protein
VVRNIRGGKGLRPQSLSSEDMDITVTNVDHQFTNIHDKE